MKRVKIKVGQIWVDDGFSGNKYRIISLGRIGGCNICVNVFDPDENPFTFGRVENDGMCNIPDYWALHKEYKEKIIPSIPLDPTLSILEAGHLQDRQRKKFRH